MPAGEICQDVLLESRKSVGISDALGQLGQVSIPHLIGAHGSASEDMGRRLRAATAGAMVIILVLPC